ncbi:putative uncharacterized protein DDB_G0283779 [Drosophila sulfurigaster albostrigata]|uniref:putative uncharacterized protein DDB_G0283779 n=1 Tax=Drosophila sulfurigaster albostrigata TaxID=89887 RepID=UPI002D21BAC9|nr:putative uncharacterized protein DDB_G0283779 [Drosophila sulfurigaster albostrigata]
MLNEKLRTQCVCKLQSNNNDYYNNNNNHCNSNSNNFYNSNNNNNNSSSNYDNKHKFGKQITKVTQGLGYEKLNNGQMK